MTAHLYWLNHSQSSAVVRPFDNGSMGIAHTVGDWNGQLMLAINTPIFPVAASTNGVTFAPHPGSTTNHWGHVKPVGKWDLMLQKKIIFKFDKVSFQILNYVCQATLGAGCQTQALSAPGHGLSGSPHNHPPFPCKARMSPWNLASFGSDVDQGDVPQSNSHHSYHSRQPCQHHHHIDDIDSCRNLSLIPKNQAA